MGVELLRPVTNLAEQAFEEIRRAILAGDLEPGRIYTASELGERIGVSRTPVREALLELSRGGLVEIVKNRGMRVIQTSLEDLLQGFEVRLMLEVPLVRRATELQTETSRAEVIAAFERFAMAADNGAADGVLRADRDFHGTLLSGSGNAKAVALLQDQRNLVLAGGTATVPLSRSAHECFEDHRAIYDAYLARDAVGAGSAMAQHISNTARMLISQEEEKRAGFGAGGAGLVAERLDWFLS